MAEENTIKGIISAEEIQQLSNKEQCDNHKNRIVVESDAIHNHLVVNAPSDNVSTTSAETSEFRQLTQGDSTTHVEKKSKLQMSQLEANPLPYKIILGVCITAVILLFSVPIILFYARDTELDANSAPSRPQQSNLSTFCNTTIDDSNCSSSVVNTYAALQLVEVFPFCTITTRQLFCEALAHCDNDSYVQNIVCQDVRQDYCTSEWRILEAIGLAEGLVNCEGRGRTAQLACTEQFGIANGGTVCLARCTEFSQHRKSIAAALSVIIVAINVANVIGGFIIFFVSYYNRKRMYQYPQVLIVINACIFTVEGISITFSNIAFGAWNPLCSEEFYPGALENRSLYCQIQGGVLYSASTTYNLCWFVFISHLFFKVTNPTDSMIIKTWQNNRTVHIIEVALIFIVGTTPYICFAATSQYQITNFPPLFAGISTDFTFYGLIFPTVVLGCVSLVMMLIVIYNIHIHFGLFSKIRSSSSCRVCIIELSIPEVKILLIFSYLLSTMILLWCSFSLETGSLNELITAITAYLGCNSGGTRKGLDCSEFRRQFESSSYPSLLIMYLLLISFLNISTLPFVIEYESLKRNIKNFAKRWNKSSDLPTIQASHCSTTKL